MCNFFSQLLEFIASNLTSFYWWCLRDGWVLVRWLRDKKMSAFSWRTCSSFTLLCFSNNISSHETSILLASRIIIKLPQPFVTAINDSLENMCWVSLTLENGWKTRAVSLIDNESQWNIQTMNSIFTSSNDVCRNILTHFLEMLSCFWSRWIGNSSVWDLDNMKMMDRITLYCASSAACCVRFVCSRLIFVECYLGMLLGVENVEMGGKKGSEIEQSKSQVYSHKCTRYYVDQLNWMLCSDKWRFSMMLIPFKIKSK